MNENVIILICYIPGPVIGILIGLLLWKLPAPYGDLIGYKTKLSTSSKEAWDYAQVTFGKLCTLIHLPVLILSILTGVFQVARNIGEETSAVICVVVLTLQLAPIIVSIFITEARLKKYFGGQ